MARSPAAGWSWPSSKDPVDAFFIHVQGSARLKLADGRSAGRRCGSPSTARPGTAYTSIGRLAVERGILPREKADKDGLEAWLKSHPGEGRALMRENRSFIFFRETTLGRERRAARRGRRVRSRALRSLAVDRTLHTFHTPVFVEAPELADPEHEAGRSAG